MLDWSWLIQLSLLCVRCMYGVRNFPPPAHFSASCMFTDLLISLCSGASSCNFSSGRSHTKNVKHGRYYLEIVARAFTYSNESYWI